MKQRTRIEAEPSRNEWEEKTNGRDMGTVDGIRWRGRRGVFEGLGYAAFVFPCCQGVFGQ